MGVKALVDVAPIDHIVGNNDIEIKLTRDEDGEIGIIFVVEDTIVRLSPVDKLISYIIHEVLEEAHNLLEKEEPKPTWREKNKDEKSTTTSAHHPV